MVSKRRAAATMTAAVAAAGAVLVSPSPASAAYSDCPSGYGCWWEGVNGTGTRHQAQYTNASLTPSYMASLRNNGTSGKVFCVFPLTNYEPSPAFGFNYVNWQQQKNAEFPFTVRSNKWVDSSSQCDP